MTSGTAPAIAGVVLLLAFIVFAFRQGARVKPDRNARATASSTSPDITVSTATGGNSGGH